MYASDVYNIIIIIVRVFLQTNCEEIDVKRIKSREARNILQFQGFSPFYKNL